MSHWGGKELLRKAPPVTGIPEAQWRTRTGHLDEIQTVLKRWDESGGILQHPQTSGRVKTKTSPSTVLVLARMDAESAAVLVELELSHCPYVAIDLDRLILTGSLSVDSRLKRIHVQVHAQECLLDEPSSLFYSPAYALGLLKDVFLDTKNELKLPEKINLLRWKATLHALEGFLGNTNWLPGPPSALEADPLERPRILGLAESLGLKVPPWILTNNETDAVQFAEKHKEVVFRELAFRTIQRNNSSLVVPIEAMTPKSIRQLTRNCIFEQSPALLQKLIHKDADLRIVLTPQRIFAFKIESEQLDWRAAVIDEKIKAKISVVRLESSLTKRLRQLADQMGLQLACVDAITRRDEVFFLEVNRPGAWFFLEALTGAPITKAITESLSV